MRTAPRLLLLALAATAAGCGSVAAGDPTSAVDPEDGSGLAHRFDLHPVATGFRQAVQVISRPGASRLYVVEQGGTIRAVAGRGPTVRPLLDIRRQTRARGEQGLLSATFTPDGAALVALFTDRSGDSRVVRYPLVGDRADASHGRRLLALKQPYPNHKGGTIVFDDRGRLVVGLGDGGKAYDPGGRAQRRDTLLGGVLRREGGRWTKVALGLRNPWRMSFDHATGRLWIGDVGQGHAEEINAVWLPEEGQSQLNLGWPAYEGRRRLRGRRLTAGTRLVSPLTSYDHGDGRCSIVGGEVYHGDRVPALRNRYVYGDFCRGTLWTLDARPRRPRSGDLDVAVERAGLPGLSSFGRDAEGELYAVNIQGAVYRLVAPRR